mgnify:CR=1 FL=1|jgi:hypothetical protein
MSTDIYSSGDSVKSKKPQIPNHRKKRSQDVGDKKRRRRSSNQGLRRLIHLGRKDENRKYVSIFLSVLVLLLLLLAVFIQFA